MMIEKIDHYRHDDHCTHHINKNYDLKYPTAFEGEQMIHEKDMLRPQNHLWEDQDRRMSWKTDPDRKSNIHFPKYGTCKNCWASGPALDEYGD
jgi:hypothetical protein